jgi:Sec-independent protein translocase protein TatA
MTHGIVLFGPVGPELLIILALIVVLFGIGKYPQSFDEISNFASSSIDAFNDARRSASTNTTSPPVTSSDDERVVDADVVDGVQTTPVTVVDGVTDTYSHRLSDAGVESVYELANTRVDVVADAAAVSEEQARQWVNEATEKATTRTTPS